MIRYLPLFILLSLLAEMLGTIGGFGSSVFFVPMASYFLDFQSVLGITALYHLSSNISKIAFFRKGFDKKLALSLGIPAVIFVSVGAYLSKFADPQLLTYILGIFLILMSLIFIIFKQIRITPKTGNAIVGGTLSGMSAGLLGTGGAIRGVTMAAFKLKKDQFIATSAIIDLAIDFSRSLVYINNGYVHKHDLYLVPILIVVSVVGTYLGKRILDHVSQEQFRGFVLILILVIGIATILNTIFNTTEP
ncbi:sulfite exporter TauE/SafE family protein [Sungkyunkwania multivorans]|uniref:Probable membrane transporter protein n=1 Tax=Sungkyunkwania multivorans TaxID=1173618 RepID=A0ABW3D441_9FLAO